MNWSDLRTKRGDRISPVLFFVHPGKVYLLLSPIRICNFVTESVWRICSILQILNVCIAPEVVARDIKVPRFHVIVFFVRFLYCLLLPHVLSSFKSY